MFIVDTSWTQVTDLILARDNISDGMMTRETDVLADVVMNALWFSDRYRPTKLFGKEQPDEELNPGKLAREWVVFFISFSHQLLTTFFMQLLGTLRS